MKRSHLWLLGAVVAGGLYWHTFRRVSASAAVEPPEGEGGIPIAPLAGLDDPDAVLF